MIQMFHVALLYIHTWIMETLQKLLEWRDISKDGRLYMRRFYLLRTKSLSIFLHYLARGDEDRDLHCHPWDWTAILLSGSYVEEHELEPKDSHLPDNRPMPRVRTRWTRIWPFLPRFRRAEYRHRLYLHKPVWTLFFHLRRRRVWGFWTPEGFVPHYNYLQVADDSRPTCIKPE